MISNFTTTKQPLQLQSYIQSISDCQSADKLIQSSENIKEIQIKLVKKQKSLYEVQIYEIQLVKETQLVIMRERKRLRIDFSNFS